MNPNTIAKQYDLLLSPVREENELESVSPQNAQTSHLNLKPQLETKSKDIGKLKCGLTVGNRSVYLCKHSAAKRKPAPVYVHSNPSAEAVLRETKVEIKDLESQVVFLQNRIKELKVENKTLLDIQSRQEKELRKFKGGVADIPGLLRSHKDEIKASESTVSSLRKELWECQKDLKTKSDIVLRKDQRLDKLNLIIQRNEKRLQEISLENKQLKVDKKKLEEENKKIIRGNEELKSKNHWFQKKIQEMTINILNAEEKLGTATHFKSMLENDIFNLQKKYEESLQNEVKLRRLLQTDTQTVDTQTDNKSTISKICMTTNNLFDYDKDVTEENVSSPQNLEEDAILNNTNIYCDAESNTWNQSDVNSITKELKLTSKPLISSSTKNVKEHNGGDNLSTVLVNNSFHQTVHNEKILYPNADEGDIYVEDGMNENLVSEEGLKVKFSFCSKNEHSGRSERQMAKRLFSNFTLK